MRRVAKMETRREQRRIKGFVSQGTFIFVGNTGQITQIHKTFNKTVTIQYIEFQYIEQEIKTFIHR